MSKNVLKFMGALLLSFTVSANASYVKVGGSYVFPDKVTFQSPGQTFSEIKSNSGFGAELAFGKSFAKVFRGELALNYHYKKVQQNALNTKIHRAVLLANLYWDIITLHNFTPFVGAGVGLASNFQRGNVGADSFKSKGLNLNVAYKLQGGVSYQATDRFNIDLTFAHTDFGLLKSYKTDGVRSLGYKSSSGDNSLTLGLRYKI